MWLSPKDAQAKRGSYEDPAAGVHGALPLPGERARSLFLPFFQVRTRPPFHWRYERRLLDTGPQQYLLFLFAFYFGWCLLAFLLTTASYTGATKGFRFEIDHFLGGESVYRQPDGTIVAVPVLAQCFEQDHRIREYPDLYCIQILNFTTLVNRRRLPKDNDLGQYLRDIGINSQSRVLVMVAQDATYGDMVHTLDQLSILADDSGLSFGVQVIGGSRLYPAGSP